MEGALIGAILLADRWSKSWAQRFLAPRSFIEIFPFLRLTYVENTGAAFGVLQDSNAFFIALSIVLLGGLLVARRRWCSARSGSRYAVALVIAGALGNLYDRLAFGHVIDFIDLRVWPVFNIADSCISVGALSLAWMLGKEERRA